MHVVGKKRCLGFTPTEEYFAKACYGISGIHEVPELPAGAKNDYLSRLFDTARANIAKEMESYTEQRTAYDAAMAEGAAIIAAIETVEDLTAAAAQMGKMAHALTSKAELGKMLNDKAQLRLRCQESLYLLSSFQTQVRSRYILPHQAGYHKGLNA
jgi:hypothetical protein